MAGRSSCCGVLCSWWFDMEESDREMVRVILVLVFLTSGCATPFSIPSAPKNLPQRQYEHSERERIEPKVVQIQTPQGPITVHVGETVERSFYTGLEQTEPTPGLLSRIMAVGWQILIIIALFWVVSIFLPVWIKAPAGRIGKKLVHNFQRVLDQMDDASREKARKILSTQDDETSAFVKKTKEKG